MTGIHQVTILAMELGRPHIGKLVQIITESWSMTGTLKRVSQHDNREWEIDYANGRRLVPSFGEIYTDMEIGPWSGQVIGNQPVTVETVTGTLEAPERTRLVAGPDPVVSESARLREDLRATRTPVPVEPPVLEGIAHDPYLHRWGTGDRTLCGLDVSTGGLAMVFDPALTTCPECKAWEGKPPLPPEPVPDWGPH